MKTFLGNENSVIWAQIRILMASTSLSTEMGKELPVLIVEKKKLKLGNCYIRIGINSETFANRISLLC